MNNLEINIECQKNYKKRLTDGLVLIIVVSSLFLFLGGYRGDWLGGLAIGLVVFLIQFYKSYTWARYYITSLTLAQSEVTINYFDKDEMKTIANSSLHFKFKKKTAFSKTRQIYLAIYYNDMLIIEQQTTGEWDESKIDSVIIATGGTPKERLW